MSTSLAPAHRGSPGWICWWAESVGGLCTAGAAVHTPPTDSAHQQIRPGDPLCAGASEVDIPAYLDELTRVQEAKGWASFAMVPYMRSRLDDVLGDAASAGTAAASRTGTTA